ncbi:MAG: phosphatase PAP2 family protein [Deltaproteobacteria bacterium]|nr:phosphatase PAP2 family protein [Deltaproteobacteria bacterium]
MIKGVLDSGVDFILRIQGFSPGLDAPFRVLTFLGNEGFYLFLLPLIYWCLDKRTGIRLSVLFLLSAYVNDVAKTLFGQPRPFEYDSRVRPLARAEGGGLPSGHTQHAVVVWGYLSLRFGRLWAWCVAALLMVLIPLSRLYLGVHFPTDLLGGYILGALLLILYVRLEPRVEALFKARGLIWQLAAALCVPGLLILLAPAGAKSALAAGATLTGIAVGMVLEERWVRFQSGGHWKKMALRFLIGTAVSLAIWAGLKAGFRSLDPEPLFRFVRYGLLGLWVAAGAPWLFCRLGLAEELRQKMQ